MLHKNGHYDIPTILGYPDMAAVREAGITNPKKAARRVLAIRHKENEKRRHDAFWSSQPDSVFDAINAHFSAIEIAKKEAELLKNRNYHRSKRRIPIVGPPRSIPLAQNKKSGGILGFVKNIFRRKV